MCIMAGGLLIGHGSAEVNVIVTCMVRYGKVIFEKELSSSSSYFQMRYLGT